MVEGSQLVTIKESMLVRMCRVLLLYLSQIEKVLNTLLIFWAISFFFCASFKNLHLQN